MFIHTLESLEQFEDYIKQLDENIGLKPETYKEVMNAISKERTKLKKLIIADVIVPKGTLSCDCPICGKEMTSQLVKHHHCKECKEHFTTT